MAAPFEISNKAADQFLQRAAQPYFAAQDCDS